MQLLCPLVLFPSPDSIKLCCISLGSWLKASGKWRHISGPCYAKIKSFSMLVGFYSWQLQAGRVKKKQVSETHKYLCIPVSVWSRMQYLTSTIVQYCCYSKVSSGFYKPFYSGFRSTVENVLCGLNLSWKSGLCGYCILNEIRNWSQVTHIFLKFLKFSLLS